MSVVPICGEDASDSVWIGEDCDDFGSEQDSLITVQPLGGTLLWIGDHEVPEFRSAYQ